MSAYNLARSLLLRMDAERAHNVGLKLMRFVLRTNVEPIPVKTAFGELSNPLGLAAGYDKTGSHLHSLSKLGFGYIVAGTFTLNPWPGNPKPRVARNVEEKTLVNALGFPNPGIEVVITNLVGRKKSDAPILASISGRTIDDVVAAYRKVQSHVAGVELNLSSPNTPALKDLRTPPAFAELAQSMRGAKIKPTYLKIPPYLDHAEFKDTLSLIKKWEDLGFEGVTAANTMRIADDRMAIGIGGYSGPPLFEHTKGAVETIRRTVSGTFEINAVGGVSSPAEATALLGLGATTVQIFTSLVYQGPSLVRRIITDPEVRRAVEARKSLQRPGPEAETTRGRGQI